MKVLIIEDEPQAAQRLMKLTQALIHDVDILAMIDSVKSSIKWINSNPSPDLILMDIQLADGISFEIFDKCEVKCPVIFTTAYDEYALKAFKVNSIDYILKPIDENDLKTAFEKHRKLSGARVEQSKMLESINQAMQMFTRRYKERFMIKVGEHIRAIETLDILFFVSLEKTTFAHTVEGRKYILDFTMDELETLLDPARFFRISRKYIVSVKSITDMISYTNSRLKLVLKTSDDKEIIVARERVSEFKEWLDR